MESDSTRLIQASKCAMLKKDCNYFIIKIKTDDLDLSKQGHYPPAVMIFSSMWYQVFKLDWVIMSIVILCILATGLYQLLAYFEKK